MDSSYYMWGERGLVATFFADLHLSGSPYAFKAFLEGIQITYTSRLSDIR